MKPTGSEDQLSPRPRRRADKFLDGSYLEDLENRPFPELRSMRDECEEFEAEVSYGRRLLQGKLDILRHEIDRRRAGGEPGFEELISKLPTILADETGPGGFGRHTRVRLPGAEKRRREIERLASEDTLAHLDDLAMDELSTMVDRLAEAESKISVERRRILQVLDGIASEMVRRYREGLQDPSALLSN
jgi:hypothetical protein